MCKSIDVAITMINQSIDRARSNEDDRYYMDFVKLHKLLYLGQCYIRSKYDMDLFEEDITAHHCGPVVDGLSQIPGICGFDLIKESLKPADFGTIDMPLSYFRNETIEKVLEEFGAFTTDQIVSKVKSTQAFSAYRSLCDSHPVLSRENIINAGNELFK